MNLTVLSKIYPAPPFCEKEILRYAGCRENGTEVSALLKECLAEAGDSFSYKVCYCELSAEICGDICDFGLFKVKSQNLALNLKGCGRVILFAATVGVSPDRLVAKYTRLSPSKALLFQAIGAERIEALCDIFCADISAEYGVGLKPRFSAGYGDLPLDVQRDIFAILEPEKRIGLTLNQSLLMSPTKSVTAFVGIGGEKQENFNKCSGCDMTDCAFRGVL